MSTAEGSNEETVPCANSGCFFWGKPSTNNYCSKCYKEKCASEEPAIVPEAKESSSETSSQRRVHLCEASSRKKKEEHEEKEKGDKVEDSDKGEVKEGEGAGGKTPVEKTNAKPVQKNKKRCFHCRKRVGLTGIECRCGYIFCGAHRYADAHECSFDYKEFDRDNLAKQNTKIENVKMKDRL